MSVFNYGRSKTSAERKRVKKISFQRIFSPFNSTLRTEKKAKERYTTWQRRNSQARTVFSFFTSGRRPAGLLATRVVVGGGDNFYAWAFREPMYVWFACPYMVQKGGYTPFRNYSVSEASESYIMISE